MNLYPLIAEKIECDPGVIDRALATLEHWGARGLVPPMRLTQWRGLLVRAKSNQAGMRALLNLLRDESEEARRLKDFAPFAGILSREERRKAFETCVYSH